MSTIPTDKPEDKTAKISQFVSQLVDAKITPLFDDIKQQREQMDRLTHELGNTNQTLSQLTAGFNQLVNAMNQPQQEATAQAPTTAAMPNLNQIPPEMKAQAVSMIGNTLAELIRAWKGSGQQAASADPMGEMGKQLMFDLFRTTVDDIQQRVYNIRKLPPPNITSPHHTLE